jgi:shikimate kinase
MNIFLIGYRCSGKTAVGRWLADRLQWTFIDMDLQLVDDCGQSIREIVQTMGWRFFREKEALLVEQLCHLNRQVIATGGGAVLNLENVFKMKSCGLLIWLRARPETIENRMQEDAKTFSFRPALTEKGSREEICEMLSERNPFYSQSMDFFVDTDDASIEEIGNAILKILADQQLMSHIA